MATAKKCDVCGKLYEMYNYNNSKDRPNGLMFLNIGGPHHYHTHDPIDCCPDCLKVIQDIIGMLGKKAKTEQENDSPDVPNEMLCGICKTTGCSANAQITAKTYGCEDFKLDYSESIFRSIPYGVMCDTCAVDNCDRDKRAKTLKHGCKDFIYNFPGYFERRE